MVVVVMVFDWQPKDSGFAATWRKFHLDLWPELFLVCVCACVWIIHRNWIILMKYPTPFLNRMLFRIMFLFYRCSVSLLFSLWSIWSIHSTAGWFFYIFWFNFPLLNNIKPQATTVIFSIGIVRLSGQTWTDEDGVYIHGEMEDNVIL